MPRKNHKPSSKSFSNLNISFNTGNLLSHPSGMATFQQQSQIVAQQRKRQKDISMLNKSPEFVKRRKDSDEIDSDIENVPSDFKRYGEVKLYGWANGRKKVTYLTEFRVGAQFSQLDDDDSENEVKYEKNEKNRLNPQKSIPKKVISNLRVHENSKKPSSVAHIKNSELNPSQQNQQNIKKSPFFEQQYEDDDNNEEEEYPEGSVIPAFLACLERREAEEKNRASRK